MNFGSPLNGSLLAWTALALGGLTVVAYILKMRRRRFEVPFSTLWHRVLREKEASSLWKHLKRLLSLALQLFILALVLFAVLDPQLGAADRDAKNVVVIIDASASMKTIDAGEDGRSARIDIAKAHALALLDSFGGGDTAMIMKMDGQTTPLSRFDSDAPMLRRIVDGIKASDTPANLRRALEAAADALRERQNPQIILIGDGAYPEDVLGAARWTAPGAPAAADTPAPGSAAPKPADDDDRAALEARDLSGIDLGGIDVRYIPVGTTGENVGIVAFNVRRYIANKSAYEVFIEVQNFGATAATRRLVLANGDTPIDVRELNLLPGEKVRKIYAELPGGDDNRLRASLETMDGRPDPFSLDDTAYALVPQRSRQKVLLVTLDNLYLEGAMLVYDNIVVDKVTPEEYERGTAGAANFDLAGYDAIVYDSYTPATLPPTGVDLMYFRPEGEHSPIPISRLLERPRITETNENHPVMKWVVLSDVNFDATQVFRLDREAGDVWLARSVRDTVIAARRTADRKIICVGFGLGGTDLILRVAFPLLLVNALDWFAGDDADMISTYSTGNTVRVPIDGVAGVTEVDVKGPTGQVNAAPVQDSRATFYGASVGIHRITAARNGQPLTTVEVATNLANPTESDIAPSSELTLGGKTLEAPGAFTITRRQSLWTYLVLLVLLILGIEWITYHRRITI